jgi:hypothetical protein
MLSNTINIVANIIGVVLAIPIAVIGISGYIVVVVVSDIGNVAYVGGKCISSGCSDSNDVIITAHMPKNTE